MPEAEKKTARERHLWERYRLSLADYRALLDAQDGRCALCRRTPEEVGISVLYVDHDHDCCSGSYTCGHCVRGLLCIACNILLSLFDSDQDYLDRIAAYRNGRAREHDDVFPKRRVTGNAIESVADSVLELLAVAPASANSMKQTIGCGNGTIASAVAILAEQQRIVKVGRGSSSRACWHLAPTA